MTSLGLSAACSGCWSQLFGCMDTQCTEECADSLETHECRCCTLSTCESDLLICLYEKDATGKKPLAEWFDWQVNCDCEPNCEGKACGADGCGAYCGECSDGVECTDGQAASLRAKTGSNPAICVLITECAPLPCVQCAAVVAG